MEKNMVDHPHKTGHNLMNMDPGLEGRHASFRKKGAMASMKPQSGIKVPIKGKVAPLGGTA